MITGQTRFLSAFSDRSFAYLCSLPCNTAKKMKVVLLNNSPFILWSQTDRVVLTLRIAPKIFGGIPNLNLHCTTLNVVWVLIFWLIA